jgi:hypothetical protein
MSTKRPKSPRTSQLACSKSPVSELKTTSTPAPPVASRMPWTKSELRNEKDILASQAKFSDEHVLLCFDADGSKDASACDFGDLNRGNPSAFCSGVDENGLRIGNPVSDRCDQ